MASRLILFWILFSLCTSKSTHQGPLLNTLLLQLQAVASGTEHSIRDGADIKPCSGGKPVMLEENDVIGVKVDGCLQRLGFNPLDKVRHLLDLLCCAGNGFAKGVCQAPISGMDSMLMGSSLVPVQGRE